MTNSLQTTSTQNAQTMQARYQRAQSLMQGIFTDNIAFNDTIYPVWIGDSDCFWYERVTRTGEGDAARFGKAYRLVDAKAATNKSAFDHKALAASLAEALTEKVDADNLPIHDVDIALNPLTVTFTAFDKRWAFDIQSEACVEIPQVGDEWLLCPNGKQAVFRREDNLWLRDLVSGEERALTLDGSKDYCYGAVSSAWGSAFDVSPLPQAQWSPDSSWLFTVQRDTREVRRLPVVHQVPKDGSLRPQLEEASLALPGDEYIETYRLVAIHVKSGRIQPANYHHIPVTCNGHGFFTEGQGWWGSDSRCMYFIDMERDHKTVRVVEFDAETGNARVLFEETTETQINLSLHNDDRFTLLPLPESNELLWFSERSGWAHLYLYNLDTGELKHPVTQGEWLVRSVLSFDAARREVFVQTTGRGACNNGSPPNLDRDPYYCDLARVNIDTGNITTLAASDHHYYAVSKKYFNGYVVINMGRDAKRSGSVSPTGNFAVVTRSRADEVPVSLVFDRCGETVLELETADISALPDGWQWPEPVKLLAADDKTDIYGLVFRPTDFSPDKSYPIISHTFCVPDAVWVSKGSFSNGAILEQPYLDAAALAELGFIVVQIDGRGTPLRHKALQDESYGNYNSASNLDDHVAGIQQLAQRYPYMDLTRVGITTHAIGGRSAVLGLLQYPDFYKVGVNYCLYDSRLESASMVAEKYEGISPLVYPPLEDQVEKLRGKLLLTHGLLDVCVPPAATFRLIEALQKANKDFDLILLPNVGHASSPDYLTRRTWDYLVKHLLGVEPPERFKLTSFMGGYEVEDHELND